MSKRTKTARAVYRITFDLEVTLTAEEAEWHRRGLYEGNEQIVKEAVTTLVDEELAGHDDGFGTRCGVNFHDATGFSAKFVEVRK